MAIRHTAVAIIPCNDLDESQAFYAKLGFVATSVYELHGYRILHDASGASVHLTAVDPGWVLPERNAYGIYLYAENLDEMATLFGTRPVAKPWGLREFAISDPNGTLVRVGWPE